MNKRNIGVLALGLMMAFSTGCTSKVVPAGTIVVVKKAKGPAVVAASGTYFAYGRDKVYFVDTKLISKSAKMSVLCKDDLNMDVTVKWIGAFAVDKDNVEMLCATVPSIQVKKGDMVGNQLSIDQFWSNVMMDMVIAPSKRVIAPYVTDKINVDRELIETTIKADVLAKFEAAGIPVKTSDILVINLDFPKEITESNKRIKQAELKELENAAISVAKVAAAARSAALATELNKAKLIDAQGDAAAYKIRSAALTPAILKLKLYDSLMALAAGPNNTATIVPYEALTPALIDTTMLKQSLTGE